MSALGARGGKNRWKGKSKKDISAHMRKMAKVSGEKRSKKIPTGDI